MRLTFARLPDPFVVSVDERLQAFDLVDVLEIVDGGGIGGELLRRNSQLLREILFVVPHVRVLGVEEQVGGASHGRVVGVVDCRWRDDGVDGENNDVKG